MDMRRHRALPLRRPLCSTCGDHGRRPSLALTLVRCCAQHSHHRSLPLRRLFLISRPAIVCLGLKHKQLGAVPSSALPAPIHADCSLETFTFAGDTKVQRPLSRSRRCSATHSLLVPRPSSCNLTLSSPKVIDHFTVCRQFNVVSTISVTSV